MDEFSSFNPIRMNYKPAKDTTVCLIFYRKMMQNVQINAIFGFKGDENDKTDGETIYQNTIQFDIKLIREFRVEQIENLDNLMDKVP